jgi:hypothetical protein
MCARISLPKMWRERRDGLAQLRVVRGSEHAGPHQGAIPTIEAASAPAINACVWRDLAQLGVEALAIGVVFSVLLALAVFVVAHSSRPDEFAASQIPPAQIYATHSVAGAAS